ncbi:MAG: T9SS type A sorting domain-containing protein [Bacteroidetes bacterium]|nr:T9SS type A sorting domain-containing protein [Bacteroidota bacterium]
MNNTTYFRNLIRINSKNSICSTRLAEQFSKRFMIALALVSGGWLLHANEASAQKKNDKPVYTCRLPLNDRPYTCCLKSIKVCELPVSDCKNNVLPSKETEQVKENDYAPKVHPKCGLDLLIKTVEVRDESENLADKPIENLLVIETLPKTIVEENVVIKDIESEIPEPLEELTSDIQEAPYEEFIQPITYTCVLYDPYPAEEILPLTDPIVESELGAGGLVTMGEDFQTIKGEEVYEMDNVKWLMANGNTSTINPVGNNSNGVNHHQPLTIDLTCYPNPTANGLVTIKYSVKENSSTGMVLFDMNGNLAKTLLAPQNLEASDYQSQFDLSDLQDGIYFCQLISGGNKTTTRIVISK